MNHVSQCNICGAPLGQYDRLCDHCLANLLADPETFEEDEPVYLICRAFGTGLVASCFGSDGLLDTVPRLDPDLYEILAEGVVWGTATVLSNGAWVIDSDKFKAGPGYVIV